MSHTTFIGLICSFSIGLSCGLLLCLPNNFQNKQDVLTENTDSIIKNTVTEIVVDTIEYELIDTTVVYWPWGREENYFFKYKES